MHISSNQRQDSDAAALRDTARAGRPVSTASMSCGLNMDTDASAEGQAAFQRKGSEEHDFAVGAPTGLKPPPYLAWKAPIERILAAAVLILCLPLLGLLILAVRLTSPGPGIYRQMRVGKGGRTFPLYKIRSMRSDAEKTTGAVWAQNENDPRVTWMGSILRATHLDELPQLWNVARGDMSLIGPRPERPEFVTILQTRIPYYLDRLEVLPGITGLAQINLPPDTNYESVWRKLILDREYIRRASLIMDLSIVTLTALAVVGLNGKWMRRLGGLYVAPDDLPPLSVGEVAPESTTTPHPTASTI